MAYVQVPKDLTRVKTKVLFNLMRSAGNYIYFVPFAECQCVKVAKEYRSFGDYAMKIYANAHARTPLPHLGQTAMQQPLSENWG